MWNGLDMRKHYTFFRWAAAAANQFAILVTWNLA